MERPKLDLNKAMRELGEATIKLANEIPTWYFHPFQRAYAPKQSDIFVGGALDFLSHDTTGLLAPIQPSAEQLYAVNSLIEASRTNKLEPPFRRVRFFSHDRTMYSLYYTFSNGMSELGLLWHIPPEQPVVLNISQTSITKEGIIKGPRMNFLVQDSQLLQEDSLEYMKKETKIIGQVAADNSRVTLTEINEVSGRSKTDHLRLIGSFSLDDKNDKEYWIYGWNDSQTPARVKEAVLEVEKGTSRLFPQGYSI